jgi:hypothetical protein
LNQPQGSNGLKRWLQRKAQALFGVSELQAQLHAISETSAQMVRLVAENNEILSRVAAQLESCGPLTGPSHTGGVGAHAAPAPTVDIEALRAIERQGLFLFGCARSGTTILMDSLNRSHDILLLAEPDLCLNQHETDFVAFLNKKHLGYGNRRIKGNYLPPPITGSNGPLEALLRLAHDYRYIGEKSAFGPSDYPPEWQQMYLDFHATYFQRGRYVFIVRRPVESIWSMNKKFPIWPIPRLLRAWLESLSLVLEAYHAFPHSRLVFFEDLGDVMIGRLAQWLEVPIPTVPGTFGNKYVRSAVINDDIPDPLRPFAALCHECNDLYRVLRESFSTEDYVYRGSTSEWAFFDARWRHVAAMLSQLTDMHAKAESERRRAA